MDIWRHLQKQGKLFNDEGRNYFKEILKFLINNLCSRL